MPEPTLALTLTDLKAEVGFFLGYGRGNTSPYADVAWQTDQEAAIDSCVRSGQRIFFWPPSLDGRSSYDWSFMKPVGLVALRSGEQAAQLPDDFGGLEGQVMIKSSSDSWFPLPVTNEALVRAQYGRSPTATGKPVMAAVRPLRVTSGAFGQRHELAVFPAADADYQLEVAYYVNPDYLTTSSPYAYGGPQHAETLLEACLSVAEKRLDDTAEVHERAFKERLLASVNMDRKLKPQNVGYNGDPGNWRRWNRPGHHGYAGITVGGVQY